MRDTVLLVASDDMSPDRRLQSLGLPGSITALERPAGLPPSLLKKAEEVFVEGGLQKPQHLIQEIKQASAQSSELLDQVCARLSL